MNHETKIAKILAKQSLMKYRIPILINELHRQEILNSFSFTDSTLVRKMYMKIGDIGGFEGTQLLAIAKILRVDYLDLFTPEAIAHYTTINKTNLIKLEK